MDSEGCSLDDTDLQLEFSTSSGFKDGSPQTVDELMYALEALDERANDSIQASKDNELYWLQTLQERDDLIKSKTKSIEDLHRLNDKLKEENDMLKDQLLALEELGIGSILNDDTEENKISLKLHSELTDLQTDVVDKLKEQNARLTERLVQSGRSCEEIFLRLRKERKHQDPLIMKLCNSIHGGGRRGNTEEQEFLRRQVNELCELYDKLINMTCDVGEEYSRSLGSSESEETLVNGKTSSHSSPRKSRPGSSVDTERYYTEMLHTLEKANKELRTELEQLQKDLTAREQGMFKDTMARLDNTNREQMEKLKNQISELSQELSLMNVDNRALRERVLKTENENEALMKQLKEGSMVENEMKSLQANLDSQLGMNQLMENKIKELELVRMEHATVCERTKKELKQTKEKLAEVEKELKSHRKSLKEAKDMQLKFDHMNLRLNNKMEKLHNENSVLIDNLSDAQRLMGASQKSTSEDHQKVAELEQAIKSLEETKLEHERQIKDLTSRLENSEKQKQNANLKVKALRERLKSMQDAWQKISNDTESSFSALRDQYQQQIKEYKSIIESLKSQNTSLTARIESMKKVTDQMNTSQSGHVNSLETQIAEYQKITEGYREENIMLRKELKNLAQAKLEESQGKEPKYVSNDEFAKLRDILSTAKTEVEGLQTSKQSHSRTSTVERESYLKESEKTQKTVKELREKYEMLSPDFSKEDKLKHSSSNERPWNKYSNLTAEIVSQKPLAASTPRRVKTASTPKLQSSSTSNVLDRSVTSATVLDTSMRRQPYKPVEPFKFPASKPEVDDMRSRPISAEASSVLSKYGKLADIQSKAWNGDASASSLESKSVPYQKHHVSLGSVKPLHAVPGITKAPSKTKEVVEIKHRNSAEMDLSKSFKPIDPDDDNNTKDGQYQSTYKPSYTSGYRSNYSISTYKSSYNPSSYTSTYKPTYESSSTSYRPALVAPMASKPTIHQNSSIDSAYASTSTSRSYPKPLGSSSGHYMSSYRSEPLPSIAAIRSKYANRGSDTIAKMVDYENKQTRKINRRLDRMETSIDGISLIADTNTDTIIRILSDTHGSTNYRHSMHHPFRYYSHSRNYPDHLSRPPYKVKFTDTAVYDPIYSL